MPKKSLILPLSNHNQYLFESQLCHSTMHLPAVNAVHRPPVLRRFIRENPLGILTTAIKSLSHPLLQSSHIPWIIDVNDDSEFELGKLRGHIARQNPQARAIIESLTSEPWGTPSSPNAYLEDDVLILFNAPAHHYITPQFYTDTKPGLWDCSCLF